MTKSIQRWLVLWITVISMPVSAGDFTFQNLDEGAFKDVIGDFSANFNHTSVSGASPLGDIYGFELGLVGGITKTPEINEQVKKGDPNAKADQIPHGQLLGVLTIPAGLTAEVGLIPKVGEDNFKFSLFSAALKFTPTSFLLNWPVQVAIKGHLTKVNLEMSETIGGVPTSLDYKSTLYGATIFVSKNFVLLEPYLGIGFVSGKGELTATGSANVFDNVYTASNSASEKVTSMTYIGGLELKLLLLKVGVEYARLFETNRFTGKVSFYF